MNSKTTIVAALGSTQTLAWASSYYLPAILGAPIASGAGAVAKRVLRHLLGGAAAVGGAGTHASAG